MGWSLGFDRNWNRDIGYGVKAYCDHPYCNNEIDRGLSYVCGGEPYGGEEGCGLFFCSEHLTLSPQICDRCIGSFEHFEAKPDHPEWLEKKERMFIFDFLDTHYPSELEEARNYAEKEMEKN